MLQTLFVVVITFCILVYAEWLSRAKQIHAELTRKFVHITVGTFIAFWPFFLTWRQIQLLSVAFLVVVCISIRLNIFSSIHSVKRRMVGELTFAIVIGVLATIISNKWVFLAAMLNLSLADGFAAITGLGWGDTNEYKVFGRTKSIVGTMTFAITSLLILVGYSLFAHSTTSLITILWLPIVTAACENLAAQGTDNLVIPLLVALVLSSGV